MPKPAQAAPAPDPNQSATTQLNKYSIPSATATQEENMVGQNTPYENLSYSMQMGPDGIPRFVANRGYSGAQGQLLDTRQRTQAETGGAGLNLAGGAFPFYSQMPDFNQGANSLTAQAEAPVQANFERFMGPARSQLDAQLENSGIMRRNQDGSINPTYQLATDALTNQQLNTEGAWLANFQPQAFNEAVTSYQAPQDMIARLMGISGPIQPGSSFGQTPTTNVQTPDFLAAQKQSLDQANFITNQKNAYTNNLMSGLFGVTGAALGGPLGAKAGSSFASGLFGGGGGGAPPPGYPYSGYYNTGTGGYG